MIRIILLFILTSRTLHAQNEIEKYNNSYNLNPKNTIIYFYTSWCKVCQIQDFVLKKNNINLSDPINQLYFLKIDGESNSKIIFFNETYLPSNKDSKNKTHQLINVFFDPKEIVYPLWVIINDKKEIIGKYFGLLDTKQISDLIKHLKNQKN